MLILSQSKTQIINIDNSTHFGFDIGKVKINEKIQIFAEFENDYVRVASYNTEKRAKEVLLEILKKAEVGCNTYIMPE